MQTATLSPKYEIVIPKNIREALQLSPGERFQVFHSQNRLEFIRIKNIKHMRGSLKGINTIIKRDQDRTF
jgi:AbrB family looped-hinge helix DNA binding protein